MTASTARVRTDSELLEANRRFYDEMWTDARLVEPERFNTWPLVSVLAAKASLRLEVAPGLRPRLPIAGTHFVDISAPALATLQRRGGRVVIGPISALPFQDASFDLVCALDIVEHVDDDERALSELARVCKPSATLLLSTPLHASRWTSFDDFVGHRRRYEPRDLLTKLVANRLEVECSAIFGMRPRSSRLVDIGMWWLVNERERAMLWYNRLMPILMRFAKKLVLAPGAIDMRDVDEVLLVCRRQPAART
jgi:SAM-dependent methyltransferase